jgi:hypothetical protein
MPDPIVLHREVLSFILNILNLVEVLCLSLIDPSHHIYIYMLLVIEALGFR